MNLPESFVLEDQAKEYATARLSVMQCTHEWKGVESQFTNDLFTDVVCVKCQCPGELNNRTKEVYFPAT